MKKLLSSEIRLAQNGEVLVQTSFEKENGTYVEKTISLDDYIDILKNGRVEYKDTYTTCTNLPDGCYGVSFTEDCSTFKVLMFVPGQVRGVTFCESFIYRVPYPNLAVMLDVKKGNMVNASFFAVKEDHLTPDTELFRYPFGNVSEDGYACFGSVSQECNSIQEVPALLDRFFEAGTNNHYYKPGETITKNISLSEQYERLNGLERYPSNYLAPCHLARVEDISLA